jgi:hypothetical protein
MKIRELCLGLMVAACVSTVFAENEPEQQVTLYAPWSSGIHNQGKACFSFKSGALQEETANRQWDLGYGFAAINGEEWFILGSSTQTRTVIKDLGKLKWTDSFEIPVLEPLPKLREGEQRSITVDASADTGKKWARTTNIMAKVVAGHIYVVRIKDPRSDFYVTFRVEDFKERQYCTITWKRVPMPRPRRALTK